MRIAILAILTASLAGCGGSSYECYSSDGKTNFATVSMNRTGIVLKSATVGQLCQTIREDQESK